MSSADTLKATTILPRAIPAKRALKKSGLVDLADVPAAAWSRLAQSAIEPNALFDPAWARAVCDHAQGRGGAQALLAWDRKDDRKLIGLLPVVPAWRALKLPVPVLVAWQGYAPLTTPLLDREASEEAAAGLLDAAAASGAHALLLPQMTIEGPAASALRAVAAARGASVHVSGHHERARLDAVNQSEASIYQALGAKKAKELRRQFRRLADDGAVTFEIASEPAAIAQALEGFLTLEANGWKGARGTALAQHAGDAMFIRSAAAAMAAEGRFEVATLARNGVPLAAGLVLRQGRRAFFFKVAYDEAEAKGSPGVQLTLLLSKHLCEDAAIDDVDSTANAEHPMIDRIWRDRLAIGDMFISTTRDTPAAALSRRLILARDATRNAARRAVHSLRALKEKTR